MKNKGITLVALVVSIIIMLILAGVALNIALGENGLLIQVQKAKEKTDEATENEISSMGELEDILHETQTGIVVEKVIDSNPGKLEESESGNTYTINSIEDLVAFANNVTTGINNYEGKTVKLGLSLDFNSTKSYVDANRTDYGKYGYEGNLKELLTTGEGFKTIGITTENNKEKNFAGIFDGNGNFINGLYINIKIDKENEEWHEIGLFSRNYGTIQNLKLLNANIYYFNVYGGYVAGICGHNTKGGEIQNCIVSGSLNNTSNGGRLAGITATSLGNITKCSNYCNLNGEFNSTDNACVAGVACTVPDDGIVENCCNYGTLSGSNSGGVFILGGISSNSNGKINYCYNVGNLSSLKKSDYTVIIGGIVGTQSNGDSSVVSNCYNIGEIFASGELIEPRIGMITGKSNLHCTRNNCYYLANDKYGTFGLHDGSNRDVNIQSLNAQEMKSPSFVDVLNQDNIYWKQDTTNINKGFPILKWQ